APCTCWPSRCPIRPPRVPPPPPSPTSGSCWRSACARTADMRARIASLTFLLLLLAPALAFAQDPQLPSLPDVTVGQIGDAPVSLPLQALLLRTAISLVPSMLLGLTAFTRIIVVLALLRQALGAGQTPSNQVLVGLALFLTALVMTPVWEGAWSAGFG